VVLYRTAGHAGGPISIVPKPSTLGDAQDLISDSFNPDHVEGAILSCYAGGHAHRLIDPGAGAEGCETDDADAEERLDANGWEQWELDLRERSLALTRRHWDEIVAVATELLRVRVLEATEVEIIADAAAGDPDADLAQYRPNFGDMLEPWRAAYVAQWTLSGEDR
jgi:hypothetical protein